MPRLVLLLLLGVCACGSSPCQKLDDHCAVCPGQTCQLPGDPMTTDPQHCLEGCKHLATLLSDAACNDVLTALAASTNPNECPFPGDFITVLGPFLTGTSNP